MAFLRYRIDNNKAMNTVTRDTGADQSAGVTVIIDDAKIKQDVDIVVALENIIGDILKRPYTGAIK